MHLLTATGGGGSLAVLDDGDEGTGRDVISGPAPTCAATADNVRAGNTFKTVTQLCVTQ